MRTEPEMGRFRNVARPRTMNPSATTVAAPQPVLRSSANDVGPMPGEQPIPSGGPRGNEDGVHLDDGGFVSGSSIGLSNGVQNFARNTMRRAKTALPRPVSPVAPGNTITTMAQPTPGGDPNLRDQVFTPGTDPRLQSAQGATDAAAAGVQGAPSITDETTNLYGRYRSLLGGGQTRFDAAKGVLQNLDENQGLARQQGIRQIGQAAAALGRTGAGMTTNDLTGLETSLNREREQNLRQLAADTTEGDINDRFRTLDAGYQGAVANNGDRYRRLGAAQDYENNVYGQGAANRNEFRTERGRQDQLAQQGIDNRIRERQLGNDEMDQRLRRALGLASVGNQGTPSLDDILRMQAYGG